MSSDNLRNKDSKKEELKNRHFHRLPPFEGIDPHAHTMSLDDLGPALFSTSHLWRLQPKNNLKKDDNPWDPWFDKCFGFVIRAKDEKSAREYADANAGEENRGGFLGKRAITRHPWLDTDYTTCTQLIAEGKEGIIIEDKRKV